MLGKRKAASQVLERNSGERPSAAKPSIRTQLSQVLERRSIKLFRNQTAPTNPLQEAYSKEKSLGRRSPFEPQRKRALRLPSWSPLWLSHGFPYNFLPLASIMFDQKKTAPRKLSPKSKFRDAVQAGSHLQSASTGKIEPYARPRLISHRSGRSIPSGQSSFRYSPKRRAAASACSSSEAGTSSVLFEMTS